jgi:hypothetical protein
MLDIYHRLFGGSRKPTEDVIKMRGCIEIALLNAQTQEVLEKRRIDNVVVTSGRSYVLSRIQSSSPQTDTINAIAVGTSTTAPATGDTLLGSEGGGASMRIAIASFATAGLTNNPPSWQAQCTFATNQANTTLGEAGLFNSTASAAQTMLSHVTFATINKTTSNTLAISYTISN